MNRKIFFIIIVSLIIISGCSRFTVEKPEGFAAETVKGTFRSFSPEGVKFRIRRFENKPSKEVSYWSESLKNHLEKKGYRLIEEKVNSGGSEECVIFYWLMNYGNDYYIYLTAVTADKKNIIVAEAAGMKEEYEKYRDVIEKSLKTVELY